MKPRGLFKSLPMVPVLSQVKSVHTLISINFNIILHLRPGLESGISTSGFPNKTLHAFRSSHAHNRPDLSHFPWHHLSNNIRWAVPIIKLLIIQFSSASNNNLHIYNKYMTIPTMLHWVIWVLGQGMRRNESHDTLGLIHIFKKSSP